MSENKEISFTNEEKIRWNAVQMKDSGFDNVFVYAVRTTGIYCKPTCPARRPKRANVVFFSSHDEAENAGFRACLRCRPQFIGQDANAELIEKICRLIESNVEMILSLEDLSAEANISPSHLQRIFKKETGISPAEYAKIHRINKFKKNVKNSGDVTCAMYDAGFNSSSRLYEKAAEEFGMTPATYARGGAGVSIIYTIGECVLGKILVAATEKGLCSVSLGDTETELEQTLFAEFFKAEICRNDSHLKKSVNDILESLEGKPNNLNLPLDVRMTAFQRRVWQELRKIPFGETRTYKEIAENIEQPKAVRAVARACATNPVAVVTPCHRVIGTNGKLSGYRWGIERKAKLLIDEKTAVEK